MPYPRMSGVLNNCALHALTPNIKEHISKLAHTSHATPFMPGYELLRQYFAKFYNIKPLNWSKFNQILQYYSAFDIQIMMGPVLRMFFKDQLRASDPDTLFALKVADNDAGLDMSDEEFFEKKSSIQADGRYSSLSPDELFLYVAKPLGIHIVYTRDGRTTALNENDRNSFHPLSTTHMYHEGGISGAGVGGHWELTDKHFLFERTNGMTFLTAHARLLGNDARVTPMGLELLKKHVSLTHKLLFEDENVTDQLDTLALTVAQIEKVLSMLNHVDGRLVRRILGNSATEDTLAFMQSLPKSSVDYDPSLMALVEDRLDNHTKTFYVACEKNGIRNTSDQKQMKLIVEELLRPVIVADLSIAPDIARNDHAAPRRGLS